MEFEYIAGDTRLVHVSAKTMAEEFVSRLAGNYNAKLLLMVPPFAQYFTDTNVEYICSQIAKVLELLFPGERFVVPVNNELADTIISVAIDNLGLTGDKRASILTYLNTEVIKLESRVQFSSFRNKSLYFKYILENDRMKTMPYGLYTRGTKGEVTISTSNYNLNNPWARHQRSYLSSSEGLEWCHETGSYRRRPNASKKKGPFG